MAARVTQVVTEVLVTANPNARVTQVVVEVLRDGPRQARVTQAVVEVLRDGPRQARVTQAVVEVLRSTANAPSPGADGNTGPNGADGSINRFNALLGVNE